jgi:hypothetical protein
MSKRISEGLVTAVLPLIALGSNHEHVRAAALPALPVVRVTAVIQHEL